MPDLDALPGAQACHYTQIDGADAQLVAGGVIDESLLSIYVNGENLATMMCSPLQLEALTVGYLYNEGIIESARDIGHLQLNLPGSVADVLLRHGEAALPRRMILTSGCGGGMTGQELSESQPALDSDFRAQPALVQRLMRGLQGAARLYNAVRGVHTAALGDETGILVSAEDVGRHNAIDKVAGTALLAGIDTRDGNPALQRAHQLGDVGQGAAHGLPHRRQPHRPHQHQPGAGGSLAHLRGRLRASKPHARLCARLAAGLGLTPLSPPIKIGGG